MAKTTEFIQPLITTKLSVFSGYLHKIIIRIFTTNITRKGSYKAKRKANCCRESENYLIEHSSWMTTYVSRSLTSLLIIIVAPTHVKVSTTQPVVKFAGKAKFEEKIIVWNARGLNSLSRLIILKSGFAVDWQRHLNKRIRRCIIPYICSNHSGGNYSLLPLAAVIAPKSFSVASKTSHSLNNPTTMLTILKFDRLSDSERITTPKCMIKAGKQLKSRN